MDAVRDVHPSPYNLDGMYEPIRQTLDFHHIEQINTMVFHFRELSREVTSHLGVIPSTVIGELRSLNQRIVDTIELMESDMVRNERAPYEAKLGFYRQEYLDMTVHLKDLVNILHNVQPQPQVTPTEQP
ncbi:hypothetical protein CRE_16668 [Caenorhabditis remanei]|uniref:Focal adhesion kinase targeting (FAT) domain-containing protein n=2 Tax=Caenorhabditis remanei TaxID=31234 RepID=E3MB03_CAERE|nr:hypothetical protein CRE_16668 [Caenorhabditis remanei]